VDGIKLKDDIKWNSPGNETTKSNCVVSSRISKNSCKRTPLDFLSRSAVKKSEIVWFIKKIKLSI
jgi:hypothetical protein